jgi:hypothetical protein
VRPAAGPWAGQPPTETIRVVATLRRFLREGTPWRGLVVTKDQASGSTLRRHLARWAGAGRCPFSSFSANCYWNC